MIDIGLRSTQIITASDTKLTLPNSLVIESVVQNFSASQKTRNFLALGISPFTTRPLFMKTINALREVVQQTDGTDNGDILVRFVGFGESSLDIEVVYWLTDPENWSQTVHDVNPGVKEKLDELGVELGVPIERVFKGK